ncbi:unnamed protein product [Dibothriocephalus latus]|uniref:Uncharacterized protein n=1 Tax=Dibothriocephalus latus TaxID=60516 RepID=A0A3P7NF61_DIBLA|nr:unnamed protein product [Dibothriocephalus latus]
MGCCDLREKMLSNRPVKLFDMSSDTLQSPSNCWNVSGGYSSSVLDGSSLFLLSPIAEEFSPLMRRAVAQPVVDSSRLSSDGSLRQPPVPPSLGDIDDDLSAELSADELLSKLLSELDQQMQWMDKLDVSLHESDGIHLDDAFNQSLLDSYYVGVAEINNEIMARRPTLQALCSQADVLTQRTEAKLNVENRKKLELKAADAGSRLERVRCTF